MNLIYISLLTQKAYLLIKMNNMLGHVQSLRYPLFNFFPKLLIVSLNIKVNCVLTDGRQQLKNTWVVQHNTALFMSIHTTLHTTFINRDCGNI